MDIIERIHLNCLECGECKLWDGYTNKAGHPVVFGATGRRKVWEAAYGPIPPGKLVTVDCDQARCLEPEHLKLTTKSKVSKLSNARPSVKAKRAASNAKTAQDNLGKITMDTARKIRASDRTGADWAEELGCSAALISHVRCNRSWKEADNPFAGLIR